MKRPYRIESRLEPGERLWWAGKPRTGIIFRSGDFFAIPFSILWCGFAVFWEWSAIQGEAPLFFALWGVPFVLVGFYFVFGRFLVDARLREDTQYALSDRRVVISSGLWSRTVRSLPLATLTDITVSENTNGYGTVTFGSDFPSSSGPFGMKWFGAAHNPVPASEFIKDAGAVERQVREAQRVQHKTRD